MNWIKLEEQLPPKNTLVWVKRKANGIEQEPIYLAMRNGAPKSTNPDASQHCHWYGNHQSMIENEQDSPQEFKFHCCFSDVTVVEWSFVVQ